MLNFRVARVLANKKFYQTGIKIQVGRFVPIYWNPKGALSDPYVLKIVAEEFAKVIKKIKPRIEVIAGGATGGISLAAATALEAHLPWVYIRAQPKGYSTNVLVEGSYKKGDRAILLDDVIATGAGKEIFIKNAEGQLKIKHIAVVLDDTGGNYPAWLKDKKIKLIPMFTKKERDHFFRKIGFFSQAALDLESAYEKNRDGWQKDKATWQKFLELKRKYKKTGKF
ncbi:MAG: hypothetical protein Q8M83_02830 [bacterium]|nr:hypothetical protein [bacterium]